MPLDAEHMEEFTLLSNFFLEEQHNLITIEVVPAVSVEAQESRNPYHPLLFIDGHLGVPEPVLHKAYIFASRRSVRVISQSLKTTSSREATDLLITSNIILLANPAHNTALNCRKVLIRKFPEFVSYKDELNFLFCLLENDKQASKSSILWHHRRWVFRHAHAVPESSGDTLYGCSISQDELKLEFDLASKAAEVYPRNYHAWLHRYICSDFLLSRVIQDEESFIELLHQELHSAKRWVELHVSDYSAVNYLIGLWQRVHQANIQLPESCLESFCFDSPSKCWGMQLPLVSHSLSLLISYPTHQTIWIYLRQACRLEARSKQQKQWISGLLIELQMLDDSSMSTLTKQLLASQEANIIILKREAYLIHRWVEPTLEL